MARRSQRKRSPSKELGEKAPSKTSVSRDNDALFLGTPDLEADEENYEGEDNVNDNNDNAEIILLPKGEEAEVEYVSQSDEGDDSYGDDAPKPVPGEENITEMLWEIGKLNLEADSVINFFLNAFQTQEDYLKAIRNDKSPVFQRFQKILDNFNDVLKAYTVERLLDTKKLDEALQVSNAFQPIFHKANIAATTGRIAIPWDNNAKAKNYMKHGAWPENFLRHRGCANMDAEDNFEFLTAWRTQIYIMGIEDPPEELDPDEWPDFCLSGLFCINADMSQPSHDPRLFEDKLRSATMSGWESDISPAPQEYQKKLKAHVRKLRKFTIKTKGNVTVDIEGLREAYPYQDFLKTFHSWLNKASAKVKNANPKLPDILQIAVDNMCDIGETRSGLKALLSKQTRESDIHYPELPLQEENRRHTYSFEANGINSGRVAPKPNLSNLRTSLQDQRSTLRKLSEIRKNGVSSSGLKPPRNAQPPKLQPNPQPKFSILAANEQAKEIDEKENIDVTVTHRGRYNQRQNKAEKLDFNDEAELRGSQGAVTMQDDQEHVARASNTITSDNTRKRKVDVIDEEDDEENEFVTLPAPTDKRPPKRRYPGISGKNRVRGFEGQAKATYPQTEPAPEPDTPDPTPYVQASSRRGSSIPRRGGDGSDDPEDDEDDNLRPVPRRVRRDWPEEDVRLLETAIAEQGPKWAIIRDDYFAKRWSDVDCKDKARNIKLQYLKNLQKLPRNFNKVTLGSTYIKQLERQGVRYIDGHREARRIY